MSSLYNKDDSIHNQANEAVVHRDIADNAAAQSDSCSESCQDDWSGEASVRWPGDNEISNQEARVRAIRFILAHYLRSPIFRDLAGEKLSPEDLSEPGEFGYASLLGTAYELGKNAQHVVSRTMLEDSARRHMNLLHGTFDDEDIDRILDVDIPMIYAIPDNELAPKHALTLMQQILKERRIGVIQTEVATADVHDPNFSELVDRLRSTCSETELIDREGNLANASTFSSFNINDLKAYKPDPKHYLVGTGWLRRGAGTLLTGGTGNGKSVLSAQIGVCVAGGIPILGAIQVGSPAKVTLVQAENDMEELQQTFLSVMKHTQAPWDTVASNLSMHHVYGLTGETFAAWIEQTVERQQPDLLIIDPYQSYIDDVDNNATTSFLQWIRPIDRLLKSRGIALLLCDHTTKPQDRTKWNVRESVYMAAGTSAKANWARTSCELTTIGQEEHRFRLRFGKNGERAGLVNEQTQGPLYDLYIERSSEGWQHPYWKIASDQDKPDKSQFRQAVYDCLDKNPGMVIREVGRMVGCSSATAGNYKKAWLATHGPTPV